MTVKIGDAIPAGTLAESTEFGDACPLGPTNVEVREAMAGKKIALFAVPGAYTPTCSAQHVPGYLQHLDALKSKGVDEVWCVAANDGFVMAAWGKDLGGIGKIRFLGDGSATWAKALGLELDLIARGMGVRMQRFSMLVDDGSITQLNIEAPGKFEVSNAETMLAQLG
jgi:glutaredoxin/glutathione-dependent peroxiredoxin